MSIRLLAFSFAIYVIIGAFIGGKLEKLGFSRRWCNATYLAWPITSIGMFMAYLFFHLGVFYLEFILPWVIKEKFGEWGEGEE